MPHHPTPRLPSPFPPGSRVVAFHEEHALWKDSVVLACALVEDMIGERCIRQELFYMLLGCDGLTFKATSDKVRVLSDS